MATAETVETLFDMIYKEKKKREKAERDLESVRRKLAEARNPKKQRVDVSKLREFHDRRVAFDELTTVQSLAIQEENAEALRGDPDA